MPPEKKKPYGQSLEARRPEIIDDLKYNLATGNISQANLARMYDIPPNDVHRFKGRNLKEITTMTDAITLGDWENIGDKYKVLASMAIDQAKAALPKASAKDAALVAQVATDKVLLLENKGVSRISVIHEHRHSVSGVLESLTREMKARGIVDASEEIPAIEGHFVPLAEE